VSTVDPDLLKQVNAGGFLLQLRLEEEIRRLRSNQGWEVIAGEHHWMHPETGTFGFIDLIVGCGIVRLVIECKRPRDGSWIFLAPEECTAERPCTFVCGLTESLMVTICPAGTTSSSDQKASILPSASWRAIPTRISQCLSGSRRVALGVGCEALADGGTQDRPPQIPSERRIYIP
jgi:hypothetical protein